MITYPLINDKLSLCKGKRQWQRRSQYDHQVAAQVYSLRILLSLQQFSKVLDWMIIQTFGQDLLNVTLLEKADSQYQAVYRNRDLCFCKSIFFSDQRWKKEFDIFKTKQQKYATSQHDYKRLQSCLTKNIWDFLL